MSAAIAYLLFAIATGDSPDLTALADFPTREACEAAATTVKAALAAGENGKVVVCIGSDALGQLAQNGVSGG